jgi:D-alanyl-D-alanine carboxypeptidase/D-alanyl-D-alanine-endopeptidase (penicillin-binding protein 4)
MVVKETRFRCLPLGRHLNRVSLLVIIATAHLAGQAPQPLTDGPRERLTHSISTLLTSPGVSRGTWGIAVRSLATGETLFEHNPRSLLVPASVAKLAALAATVDAVGWDFAFETSLRTTGPITGGVLRGDLIVVGTGDPSIGGRAGEDFTSWIAALKQAGITRIDGRIIGDDDAIDDPRPGAMWAWDDLGYTSGALFGALNYSENRMTVTVTPGARAGLSTTLGVSAEAEGRPLLNRSMTGPAGSAALIWPEQRPGETALTIAGSLPSGSSTVRLPVSVGDPTRWFVGVLQRELERAGISVTGGSTDIDDLAPKPDSAAAAILHVHRSKPLRDLAQPLLKDSINLYSEAVLRMATGLNGGRTNDDALAALKERLITWGLPFDGVQVVDGSGLSRRDGIAADTLVGILARMYDATFASPWMTGLPVAGRDGSLENRFRSTRAESALRAKTGTMSNIRSLAGYVHTRDHEPVAFVIMVNNFEGDGRQAQAVIDAIAVALADFSHADR